MKLGDEMTACFEDVGKVTVYFTVNLVQRPDTSIGPPYEVTHQRLKLKYAGIMDTRAFYKISGTV